MRKLIMLLFPIILVAIASCYTPKEDPLVRTEGMYMLEFVLNSGDLHTTFPIELYKDPNWAYYSCNADKENYLRKGKKALEKYHNTVVCARYYGGEV